MADRPHGPAEQPGLDRPGPPDRTRSRSEREPAAHARPGAGTRGGGRTLPPAGRVPPGMPELPVGTRADVQPIHRSLNDLALTAPLNDRGPVHLSERVGEELQAGA